MTSAFPFLGESKSAIVMRSIDWGSTDLGPTERWTPALKFAVANLLRTRHPMFLFWGPHAICFYNDAYAPSFGTSARVEPMGRRGRDVFREIWGIIGGQIDQVMSGGEATWHVDDYVPFHRNGRFEEIYWTYSYSAVTLEDDLVGGVLVTCTETTSTVQLARRTKGLRLIIGSMLEASTVAAAASVFERHHAAIAADVPLILSFEHADDGSIRRIVHAAGVDAEHASGALSEALQRAVIAYEPAFVEDVSQILPSRQGRAFIVPAIATARYARRSFVFGLSDNIPFDDAYREFFLQLATNAASAFETKATQADTELARQELQAFYMQAPTPTAILTGSNHLFLLANPLYEQYVGRPVTGRTLREVFPEPEIIETYEPLLDQVRATGETYVGREMPVSLATPGVPARMRWIDFIYKPIVDGNGLVRGIIAQIQDITAQVDARNVIEASRDSMRLALSAAEAASTAKTDFLANMSHEIRTPLSAILGYSNLLVQPSLAAADRSAYVETIQRNGAALTRLIDDILDLAKVEAGKLEIESMHVVVRELLGDVIQMFDDRARQKNIGLSIAYSADVPFAVTTDPTRLRQIITNLVGNAVKFTARGGITVQVTVSDGESQRLMLRLDVTDTGIGLGPDEQRRLFEPFVQADNTTTRRFGGTGLGLNLSRRLAHAMGGDVFIARSSRGEGSTFSLVLPTSRAPDTVPERKLSHAVTAKNLAGFRILLAEDAKDIQLLVQRILTVAGAAVDVANDGEEAIERARSTPYDVILMDIQMPRIDGLEATRCLRSLGLTTPIIALTAHAMANERDRTLAAGCNAHLSKPVDVTSLLALVGQWCRASKG